MDGSRCYSIRWTRSCWNFLGRRQLCKKCLDYEKEDVHKWVQLPMIYFSEGDSPTNWMQCFRQQFVNKEEKYLLCPADWRYGRLCNCDGERKRERELAAEIDAFEGIIGRSLIKEGFFVLRGFNLFLKWSLAGFWQSFESLRTPRLKFQIFFDT